jgi:hypothetical protein
MMEYGMRNLYGKIALLVALTFVMISISAGTMVAKEIKVILKYEDSRVCTNECGISNDYNHKDACANSDGVAMVDVGEADGKVTIYVKGKAAGCARPGETITIYVRNTATSIEPVNRGGC